jgi:uncharacterized protein YndB with AHSA1/START domain
LSHTVTHIPVVPERVFDVLSDPRSYAYWVVGAHKIRDVDDGWPAPGTRLHHRVGVGPLKVDDNTEVVECVPPTRLVLQARTRPFGAFRISIGLEPWGDGGTRVTMDEGPGGPVSKLLHNRLVDLALDVRNILSLNRLDALATGEKDPPPLGAPDEVVKS